MKTKEIVENQNYEGAEKIKWIYEEENAKKINLKLGQLTGKEM